VQLQTCCGALEAARLGVFDEKLMPRGDGRQTDKSRNQHWLASERGLQHEQPLVEHRFKTGGLGVRHREKRKMIATRLRIRLAAMLATLPAAGALADEGRPVIASDVAGKKICWNTGQWDMYEVNGQFTNNYGRHSRWSIAEPGILKRGPQYRQVEVLPDGRFHLHYSSNGDRDYWGTACN
jgi:hypothetical protein